MSNLPKVGKAGRPPKSKQSTRVGNKTTAGSNYPTGLGFSAVDINSMGMNPDKMVDGAFSANFNRSGLH